MFGYPIKGDHCKGMALQNSRILTVSSLQFIGCLIIFTFMNLLKVLIAKLLSSYFHTSTHFSKMQEALAKVISLIWTYIILAVVSPSSQTFLVSDVRALLRCFLHLKSFTQRIHRRKLWGQHAWSLFTFLPSHNCFVWKFTGACSLSLEQMMGENSSRETWKMKYSWETVCLL